MSDQKNDVKSLMKDTVSLNESSSTFHQEVLDRCHEFLQAQGGKKYSRPSEPVLKKPSWNAGLDDLKRALSMCDTPWLKELQKSGVDIRHVGSQWPGGAFDAFWSRHMIHEVHDPRRLHSTIQWMDDNNLGLSDFEHFGTLQNAGHSYSGLSLELARKKLERGGLSKKEVRLKMVSDWLRFPGVYYGKTKGSEPWRAGLEALLGYSRTWFEDQDIEARVSPEEVLNVWAQYAGKSTSGLIALTAVPGGGGDSFSKSLIGR